MTSDEYGLSVQRGNVATGKGRNDE